MILYQLRCSNNHEFEVWFRDSAAYDAQIQDGDVTCPQCGDGNISKAIMAPNITTKRSKTKLNKSKDEMSIVDDKVMRSLELVRSHVEKTCDNVGGNFAEEARKIHYGEAEKRGIYGEATYREASELNDEGIDFYQLPSRVRRNS